MCIDETLNVMLNESSTAGDGVVVTKPAPSFFPTNKELGIVMSDDASSVPPIPSYGGKE